MDCPEPTIVQWLWILESSPLVAAIAGALTAALVSSCLTSIVVARLLRRLDG